MCQGEVLGSRSTKETWRGQYTVEKKKVQNDKSIKASASFEGHSLGLDYLAVNL